VLALMGPHGCCWQSHSWAESFREFLGSKRARDSKLFYRSEEAANCVFPKSIVL
jgi:hypothetical protein